MIAAYLESAGVLSIRDVGQPQCGSDEALIRVAATGICGSDLHYFREGRIKDNIITEPLVLGHESAGEVVAVGSEVNHLRPGDRVTIEPGVPCLQCEFCLSGRYNLCDDVRFLGAPPTHGTFRELITHKALFVHKLPDCASFDEGACVEPLAVGFHASERAGIRPGDRVLVTGSGTIGLVCMLFARISGAQVTMADMDAYRLNIARQMGADDTINVTESALPSTAFDCIVEATGNPAIYPTVIDALAKGGRVAVVGMSNEAPSVDLTALMRKEAVIRTVYRYANCFQPVLRLLAAGKIDVNPIVSHRFPLNRIADAFELAGDPSRDKMKVMVNQSNE